MATERTGRRAPESTTRNAVTAKMFEDAIFDLEGSSEFVNMMVYGDSGCGKTVLAGTLPGRKLVLAGEPGYISAVNSGAKNIKGRLIPDTATALAAANWLEDGGANRYDWVIADGIGTMQNKFLLGYTAEAFDNNPKSRAHRNLPDKPDYFNAQNFMKSWVSMLIDLPCNVLFTAHAMRPESPDGDQLVFPSIQGKGYEVSNYISGLMHCVGYMEPVLLKSRETKTVRQVRRIRWAEWINPETGTRVFAKDQFNRLAKFTDDATMPKILDTILAEKTPDAPASRPPARTRRVRS